MYEDTFDAPTRLHSQNFGLRENTPEKPAVVSGE